MSRVLDLGHGHTLRLTVHGDPERVVGAIDEHRRPDDGRRCSGFVTFDVPEADAVSTGREPRWTVESWEPLTLSPSLLCRSCGDHGFVREGRWVPA